MVINLTNRILFGNRNATNSLTYIRKLVPRNSKYMNQTDRCF